MAVSSRISSISTRTMMLSHLMKSQKNVDKYQQQLYSEKKSPLYSGYKSDVSRLVSMENQVTQTERFMQNNEVAKMRLSVMNESIESADTTVQNFREMVSDFSKRDLTQLDETHAGDIQSLQVQAFNAMKDLEYFLNQEVDGRYLFGGGKVSEPPVDIGFKSLEAFQKNYDGISTTFPRSRPAQLLDLSLDRSEVGGTLYMEQTQTQDAIPENMPGGPAPADHRGIIRTNNSDTFVLGSTTGGPNTTGNLHFDDTGPGNPDTITASKPNAFFNLEAGDTIIIKDDSGNNHDVVATIEKISEDKRVLELAPDALNNSAGPPGLDPADITIQRSVPIGSTIDLSNLGGGNEAREGAYTVLDVHPDGDQLTLQNDDNFPPAGGWTSLRSGEVISGHSYYNGDDLNTSYRADKNKEMEIGINAKHAAFEKALRGMATIAQGNLYDENDPAQAQERVNEALKLLDDAMSHDGSVNELPGDMQSLMHKMQGNMTSMERTMETQENFSAFLTDQVQEIENVDPKEAAMGLHDSMQTLETSYAALARTQELSLLNFL